MYLNHHRAGVSTTWRRHFSHFSHSIFERACFGRGKYLDSVYGLVIQLLYKSFLLGRLFQIYWFTGNLIAHCLAARPAACCSLVQHQKLIFFLNSWLLYLFCPRRGSWSLVCQSTAVWRIAHKWFPLCFMPPYKDSVLGKLNMLYFAHLLHLEVVPLLHHSKPSLIGPQTSLSCESSVVAHANSFLCILISSYVPSLPFPF